MSRTNLMRDVDLVKVWPVVLGRFPIRSFLAGAVPPYSGSKLSSKDLRRQCAARVFITKALARRVVSAKDLEARVIYH